MHPDVKAVSFVGSTPIANYIYGPVRGMASACRPWRRQEPHGVVMPDADLEQTVDALMGQRLRLCGERCMAISVAVWWAMWPTSWRPMVAERPRSRVKNRRNRRRDGPHRHKRAAYQRITGYIGQGVGKAPPWWWTAATGCQRRQGGRQRFLAGPRCLTT